MEAELIEAGELNGPVVSAVMNPEAEGKAAKSASVDRAASNTKWW